MKNFLQELKERNVIKAALAYAVVAWIILQILSTILPNIGAPEWVFKTLMLLIFVGFPIWVVFSWIYEVTPDGLKKTKSVNRNESITATTNKRLNVLILVGLVAAICVALLRPNGNTADPEIALNDMEQDLSIAVLPFDDMSSEGDTQWFCDGMTEDILTHLSKISGLRVISRTSVMRYKNHQKTMPEIAKELGVSHILEGSVRKQNDNVLITAQLIKANDEHLWADNYNEKLDNVFKIQSDVSKKIVEQLRITLSPEEEESINKTSTENVEAYELYLKGRYNDGTKEGYEESVKLLKQAIALDPDFADAYATIGRLTLYNVADGLMDYDQGLIEAKQYIDNAFKLNPKNTLAFEANVLFYRMKGDWEKVKENAEQALALNPNDFDSRRIYADYFRLKPKAELDKYLENIEIVQKLDPFSSLANSQKILALLYNKHVEKAEAHYAKMKFSINEGQHDFLESMINAYKNKDQSLLIKKRVSDLAKDPDNPELHNNLGGLYLFIAHDYEKSLYHYKKAYELRPPNYFSANRYFYALLYMKQFKEAERLLNDNTYMEVFNGDRPNYIYFDYHFYKGEYQKALSYLEKHEVNSQYYLNKAAVHASLGNSQIVMDIIENKMEGHYEKALIYGILENRDSMYFHLHKVPITRARTVNQYPEFNKYRSEPRFIEFLNKNYLPTSSYINIQ